MKKCPNGTRKNKKTGLCEKYSKLYKRCPNGTRKNKKTGLCVPKIINLEDKLINALENKKTFEIKKFIHSNIKLNLKNIKKPIINIAMLNNIDYIIPYLIKNGAIINNINYKNNSGNTLLHLAIMMNDYKLIKHLLKNMNINVNIKNNDGNTPLHLILLSNITNKKEIIKLILDKKFNFTLKNNNNQSIHDLLQFKNNKDFIKIINLYFIYHNK